MHRKNRLLPNGSVALFSGTTLLGAGGFALAIYLATLAPGYTWANDGADGGDLLAAARVSGVPHPSGYPLYTLLLAAILRWIAPLAPTWELAYWGNLWSAISAALAAGLTASTALALLDPSRTDSHPADPSRTDPNGAAPMETSRRFAHLWRASIALAVGISFAATPLLWGQALITEVYAFHALLIAGLGWAVVNRCPPWFMAMVIGGGLAHHLTFGLLLPGALYSWVVGRAGGISRRSGSPAGSTLAGIFRRALRPIAGAVGGGLLIAGLFYLRLPWAAGAFSGNAFIPPPVLWGFPDNGPGIWWVMSGAPYREFVLGVPPAFWPGRLAGALALLVAQYTLPGLLLAVVGLLYARRYLARLASPVAMGLWLGPVFFYAVTYNTADSYVYLLPVVWMAALCGGVGAAYLIEGLARVLSEKTGDRVQFSVMQRVSGLLNLDIQAGDRRIRRFFGGLVGVGCGLVFFAAVVVLALWRVPQQTLRDDLAARHYLDGVAAVVTPQSLIVTGRDAETFALWYAAWATGELGEPILVNIELYHHPWYQRLLSSRYPHLAAVGRPWPEFATQNGALYTIWLTEPFDDRMEGRRIVQGPLWQYLPPDP